MLQNISSPLHFRGNSPDRNNNIDPADIFMLTKIYFHKKQSVAIYFLKFRIIFIFFIFSVNYML